MIVLETAKQMRDWSRQQRAQGRSIGLVPTMGALHEGHASLIRESVANNDVTVLSIFVNPAQFAPHEDFESYPRTFEDDCIMAQELGVTAIYAPRSDRVYPDGYATYVTVERLSEGLCGGSRPVFFRGIATVVTKLFNAVDPDRAYFGQKDAQQCAIIKRMVRDLEFDIDIVEMPIVREADGLAMSSRNRYLSAGDRQRALCLSRALQHAKELMDAGERDTAVITAAVRDRMQDVPIDYIALVDANDVSPLERVDRPILLAVAANIGPARLIDNLKYTPVECTTAAPQPTAMQGSQS
jgi:pantoate--beta-alanine ligase